MEWLKSIARPLAFIGLVTVLAAGFAHAQTFRGTILGTITDSTGAAIPGARVVIKNQGTAQTRQTFSGDAGTYAVPELPVGQYAVTVSKEGFESMSVADVVVTVASEHRVDVTLRPGKIESSIQVEASVPMVATTEDTLGGTVAASQMANLPVNGRDYTKLIYMQPGVTGSPDQATDSPGSFGKFSVNGARGRSNNFLLDGTDMNDGYRNDPAINQPGVFGTPSTILPVDAVAELAVLSNFAPEYGRNAGAIINIVTKSGTNQLHGTAAEFLRNNALDARNFFNTAPSPKTAFHNNQFGGSLGGPIVKDKTFFFADYEGQREVGGLNSLDCAPTASDIATASVGHHGEPGHHQAPGHESLAHPELSRLRVVPTFPPPIPIHNRIDSVIGKIDHNFDQKHILTGRYYFGNSDQSFPLALVGGGVLPGYNTYTPTRVQLVSLSQVTVFLLHQNQ